MNQIPVEVNAIMPTATPSLDEVSTKVAEIIPKPNPQLLEQDLLKALRVVERILSCSDDDIESRAFLLNCFHEYGIPLMIPDFWRPWANYMNPSGFGALQIPTEIVDCLGLLIKLDIKTAIEIGTYRGGLSYFMTAVLQRVRSDFRLTMVDPWDSLLGFETFSRMLNLTKVIPGTSDDFAGKHFDFVFIDGDHSYDGAMRDFFNTGRHANKVLGFHDIHDHSADVGTVRAWDDIKTELCQSHTVYEIAHSVPRGLGIGLAIRSSTNSQDQPAHKTHHGRHRQGKSKRLPYHNISWLLAKWR